MHYLLIHGSWHGAWCWEKLTPYLLANKDQVTCFDLPGSGEKFGEINEVTFDLLLNTVKDELIKQTKPVVLIAHSFAGLLTANLAEEFHHKINHIFYLAAWLPRKDYSLVDMAVEYNNSDLPSIFSNAPNPNWTQLDTEGARNFFYHDCGSEIQNFALSHIKPKNGLPDRTKMKRVFTKNSIHKSTYVLCTEDKVINPLSQKDMAIRFGLNSEQIIPFKSGHSPFLSQPEMLAQLIIGVERG
ncbi:MAG: alpha/beta hydrolase [Tatlockia sp.]|nr:alpha/beta hydrolase [Tatlockia sp.]